MSDDFKALARELKKLTREVEDFNDTGDELKDRVAALEKKIEAAIKPPKKDDD